jgi:hypothetical protein
MGGRRRACGLSLVAGLIGAGRFPIGGRDFFPFCRAVFDCCLPALLVAIHFCFGAICYDTVLKLLLPFPYLVLNIFRHRLDAKIFRFPVTSNL